MSKIKIIQGENAVFTIKLRDELGDAVDLTPYDKYSVCLPAADGSVITISEVANANASIATVDGSPIKGFLKVQVKLGDTALLLVEDRMTIDLLLDNAGSPDPKKAQFANVLTVLSSLC